MSQLNTANRVWWIGILLVMGIAALVYIPGYDYGLPYLERVDERTNLNETYMLRGLVEGKLTKPGYPPGILWVYEGAQVVTEAVTGESALANPGLVMHFVRLSTLIVILIGIFAVGLNARQLGGNWAGFLAAVVWLISPAVIPYIMVGYPQPWEFMLYGLTLYFALHALMQAQPGWAILSVLCGLGAVLFKYVAFPILGFGVGVSVWYLRSQPKRWGWALAIQAALIIVTAAALYSRGVDLINSGHSETSFFVHGGVLNIFNVALGTDLISRSVELINLPVGVFVVLITAATVVYWRQRPPNQRLAWVVLAGLTLFNIWSVAAYLVYSGGFHRYTVPSSSYLAILTAVAAVTLAQWLAKRFQRRWLTTGIVGGLLFLWIAPTLQSRIQMTQRLTWPITPVELTKWAANTLPENNETLLVSCDWQIFTAVEGGYQGPARPVKRGFELAAQPASGWHDEGVYYALVSQEELEALQAAPEGTDYLADLTLLKQIPSPTDERQWRRSQWRNTESDCRLEDLSVFWTGTIGHEMDVTFGGQIRLLGYDLSAAEVHPGDTITLRLFWQAVTPPQADYQVFNHLMPLDSRETPLAQGDGQPARNIHRATYTWNDPDEVLISPDYAIPIPADLAIGEYRLMTGLYDIQTGERLLTERGDDFSAIIIRVVSDK